MDELALAPALLLAMPQMTDPNFTRAAVLLCRHDEDGALGFVLNRPMGVEIADLLIMEDPLPEGTSLTAWEGGPVSPERGWLICRGVPGAEATDSEDFLDICEGLYMSSSQAHLQSVLAQGPVQSSARRRRLLLGYAGWAPGQLDAELRASAWLHVPVDEDMIFETAADDLWETAIRSLGVDPLSIAPGPGLH